MGILDTKIRVKAEELGITEEEVKTLLAEGGSLATPTNVVPDQLIAAPAFGTEHLTTNVARQQDTLAPTGASLDVALAKVDDTVVTQQATEQRTLEVQQAQQEVLDAPQVATTPVAPVQAQVDEAKAQEDKKARDSEDGRVLSDQLEQDIKLTESLATSEEAQQEVLTKGLADAGYSYDKSKEIIQQIGAKTKESLTRLAHLRSLQASFNGQQTGTNGIVRNLIQGWVGDPFAARIKNAQDSIAEDVKNLQGLGDARAVITKMVTEDNPIFGKAKADKIRYDALQKRVDFKSKLLANETVEADREGLVADYRSRYPKAAEGFTDSELYAYARQDARNRDEALKLDKVKVERERIDAQKKIASERNATSLAVSAANNTAAGQRKAVDLEIANVRASATKATAATKLNKPRTAAQRTDDAKRIAVATTKLKEAGKPVPPLLTALATGEAVVGYEQGNIRESELYALLSQADADADPNADTKKSTRDRVSAAASFGEELFGNASAILDKRGDPLIAIGSNGKPLVSWTDALAVVKDGTTAIIKEEYVAGATYLRKQVDAVNAVKALPSSKGKSTGEVLNRRLGFEDAIRGHAYNAKGIRLGGRFKVFDDVANDSNSYTFSDLMRASETLDEIPDRARLLQDYFKELQSHVAKDRAMALFNYPVPQPLRLEKGWSFGGKIFGADSKIAIDTPEGLKALQDSLYLRRAYRR